jgi:hypothetical protein
MSQIKTKREAIDLAQRGRFGNTMPVWKSLEEVEASGYTGNVMVRYAEPGSAWNIPSADLATAGYWVHAFCRQGALLEKFHFTVGGSCGSRLINGEVMQNYLGFQLHYNDTQPTMVMRESLKQENGVKNASGLQAKLILQHYMDPSSYADLEAIWDEWPDAVVEFTVFSQDVGNIPRRNTIFWEVRSY